MNFARDVVDAMPAQRLALVELTREGSRREWTFGEVARALGARSRARSPRAGSAAATS